MIRRASMSIIVVACIVTAAGAAVYEELVPKFSRMKSNAMVRKVTVPTLANLDYAAYTANPVLFEAQKVKPKPPSPLPQVADVTFGGNLVEVKDRFADLPLSGEERGQPMAWKPLCKKLWNVIKDPALDNLTGKINGYKWADPSVFQPYQEVSAAWLHAVEGTVEIWVKIEFSPWVKFLKSVSDEDGDGLKEIYGKLDASAIAPDLLAKAVEWIRGDYLVRTVTRQEAVDWVTDLASYWYPTRNTDVLDMGEETAWPNSQTEKKVVKTVKGLKVEHPAAVVRGRPFGQPIYNVYVVDNLKEEGQQDPAAVASAPAASAADKVMDTTVSAAVAENNKRFDAENKQHGDYAAWTKKNAAALDGLKKFLDGLPPQQMGFKGREDWLFFRKSLEYVLGGDLANQAPDKNPVPNLVAFQKYLADNNINMLFVPVPNKEEVYPEKLPVDALKTPPAYLNPYGRKFLRDAQAAGIEVVDLLPLFLKAKKEDKNHKESLYQHQDTHWTNRGLQIAAEAIAQRIRQYAWYQEAAAAPIAYTVADTTFSRQGDIVDKLPEADRAAYPAVELAAQQVVLPDGTRNKPNNATAPICLIGDSFTGVFELVDCKSAGVGSHMAAKTGLPVDIITSWGGGPLVREKFVKGRKKNLGDKRLVVYMMVARDLYNYSQLWAPLQTD